MSLSQLAIINGGFIRGNRAYEQGYSFTLGDVEREFPFPKKPFFIETLGMPAASLLLVLMVVVITHLSISVAHQERISGRLSRWVSAPWKNGLVSSCPFRGVRH